MVLPLASWCLATLRRVCVLGNSCATVTWHIVRHEAASQSVRTSTYREIGKAYLCTRQGKRENGIFTSSNPFPVVSSTKHRLSDRDLKNIMPRYLAPRIQRQRSSDEIARRPRETPVPLGDSTHRFKRRVQPLHPTRCPTVQFGEGSVSLEHACNARWSVGCSCSSRDEKNNSNSYTLPQLPTRTTTRNYPAKSFRPSSKIGETLSCRHGYSISDLQAYNISVSPAFRPVA